jgi:hypothetical protein
MIAVELELSVGTASAAFCTITLFTPRHAIKRSFETQSPAPLHGVLRGDACELRR